MCNGRRPEWNTISHFSEISSRIGILQEPSNKPPPENPELSATAAAIEEGRKIVRRARQLEKAVGQQVSDALATADEADQVLDEAQQLLNEIERKQVP